MFGSHVKAGEVRLGRGVDSGVDEMEGDGCDGLLEASWETPVAVECI